MHPGSFNVMLYRQTYVGITKSSRLHYSILVLHLVPVPAFAVNMSLGLTMTWDPASGKTLVRGSLIKQLNRWKKSIGKCPKVYSWMFITGREEPLLYC